MSVLTIPTLSFANGVTMPQLGLGTWPLDNAGAAKMVAEGLALGYRLIDTAENYANETGVGEGIKAAGIARSELFVTTKFNRQWHSRAGARAACLASLQRLGLTYVDLLLIHWPNPDQDRYVEAFAGILELVDEGLVRAAGTSNFKATHLARLFEQGYFPQLNQIQADPYHGRDDLIAVHRQHGIVTQTWRPLGFESDLLDNSVVRELAQAHQRSPAQIVLRWAVQQGLATIPKTANRQRMVENAAIFDFALSNNDMQALHQLRRDDGLMLDADAFGH